MIIDTRNATPGGKPPLERKPEPRVKRKSQAFRLHIYQIDTQIITSPYKRASDNGRTHYQPMILLVKVQALCKYPELKAYFTHRVEFERATGLVNGDHYAKQETDFIRVEKLDTLEHRSTSPETFPDAFALELQQNVHLKLKEGDDITVTALAEEKTSSANRKYLQLSRVALRKEEFNE